MPKNNDTLAGREATDAITEAVIEAGALEILYSAIALLISRGAEKLDTWLSQELRTPANSTRPTVTFPEQGPWNGVVVVEADQPTFWGLVRSGPPRPAAIPPAAPRPHEQRYSTSSAWPRPGSDPADPYDDDALWRRW